MAKKKTTSSIKKKKLAVPTLRRTPAKRKPTRKREDFSQAAVRIVRQATENE